MKNRNWPHHRYAAVLLGLYGLTFAALAVHPHNRADWALENALAGLLVLVLFLTRNTFPLSRVSYTGLFLFMCVHTVGAHYTYSHVPYDRWFTAAFGRDLNGILGWERNNFDRVVHFLYGLLFVYSIREVLLRIAAVRGFWGYFLPLQMTMSTSVMYELIEWGAAEVFGGDLGIAYVGSQGDVWDAQKDMGLATLGGIVTLALVAAVNGLLQRGFAQEWTESLRVKRRAPLGEDRIIEALEEREAARASRPRDDGRAP